MTQKRPLQFQGAVDAFTAVPTTTSRTFTSLKPPVEGVLHCTLYFRTTQVGTLVVSREGSYGSQQLTSIAVTDTVNETIVKLDHAPLGLYHVVFTNTSGSNADISLEWTWASL